MCGSSPNVFLKIAVTKKLAKYLNNTCEVIILVRLQSAGTIILLLGAPLSNCVDKR